MAMFDQPTGGGFFSRADHLDLHQAAALVSAVISRHTRDITLPALSALNAALHELRAGERYLGGEPE